MSDELAAAVVKVIDGKGETPSASDILTAVAKAAGAATGAGIWIDVRSGDLDKGTTVTLYERGPLGILGLIGRKTFGAALGYDVAKSGKVEVTVFAGAAHPYDTVLRAGWRPVAGVSIQF